MRGGGRSEPCLRCASRARVGSWGEEECAGCGARTKGEALGEPRQVEPVDQASGEREFTCGEDVVFQAWYEANATFIPPNDTEPHVWSAWALAKIAWIAARDHYRWRPLQDGGEREAMEDAVIAAQENDLSVQRCDFEKGWAARGEFDSRHPHQDVERLLHHLRSEARRRGNVFVDFVKEAEENIENGTS